MNQHDDKSEKLSAYLDGELDERQAAEVERAVAADAALARELQELRAVRQLLRDMPHTKAPEGFVEHVMDRAQRMHLARPQAARGDVVFRWVRRSAAAAILLAFVSICGFVGYNLYKATKLTPHAQTPEVASRDDSTPGGGFGDARPGGDLTKSIDGAGIGGETNLTICTNDLPATRKELEYVLTNNGVALDKQPPRVGKGDYRYEITNNTAFVQRARDEEVIYEVNADDAQAVNIRNEINRLQVEQQVAMNMSMNNSFFDKNAGEEGLKKEKVAEGAVGSKSGDSYTKSSAGALTELNKGEATAGAPAAAAQPPPAKQQTDEFKNAAGQSKDAADIAATRPAQAGPSPIAARPAGRDVPPATRPATELRQSEPPLQVAQGTAAEDDRSREVNAKLRADRQREADKLYDGQQLADNKYGSQQASRAPGQASQSQEQVSNQSQLARQSQNQPGNRNLNNRGNFMTITLQYRPADSPNMSQTQRSQVGAAAISAPSTTSPAAQNAAKQVDANRAADANHAAQPK